MDSPHKEMLQEFRKIAMVLNMSPADIAKQGTKSIITLDYTDTARLVGHLQEYLRFLGITRTGTE